MQWFIRRLSIQHMDQDIASVLANEDLSHVRSLTVTTSGCIEHLASLVEFKVLRVLDLDDPEGLEEYDMNGVDKLFQLKFFRLSGLFKPELPSPSGIVMLRDLETLDLRDTDVEELPVGIVRLVKLQYLLAESDCNLPDGIGNMRSLRVISGFSITKGSVDAVEELGSLKNLNELDVHLHGGECDEYKKHEEMLLSSLCKLGSCKLQCLRITRYGGPLEFLDSWAPPPFSLQIYYMSSDYYFTNIPKWIAPELTSLAFLDINLTELRKEGLHTLGELPALLCLKLWFIRGLKERLAVQGIGFPSLKEFGLYDEGVAYVTFMKGAMPKLENLKMPFQVSVARTYGFCLGIEHLPCLKEATVELVNEGATPSVSRAAAAVIRKEADEHPNHPKLTIKGECYEETGSDDEKSKKDGETDEN